MPRCHIINGIKHADDANDAFLVAELLRLNILPTGHLRCPIAPAARPACPATLVHHRTALMLSFKSLYTRTTGHEMR
jgi:transposase